MTENQGLGNPPFLYANYARGLPTVGITGAGAGWDSAGEQEKPEASLSWPTGQGKMPENAAESHTSGARFVGQLCSYQSRISFRIPSKS